MSEIVSNQNSNSPARLPSATTMNQAARLSITEDKPIMLDYWLSSCKKESCIGVRTIDANNKEKMLVKSEEEYTSPISKLFKNEMEYIVMTENSIYIVDSAIPPRRIS
jgi:hypothetical protein